MVILVDTKSLDINEETKLSGKFTKHILKWADSRFGHCSRLLLRHVVRKKEAGKQMAILVLLIIIKIIRKEE